VGGTFAHHDVVNNSVVCDLVCSKVSHSFLLLDNGLKVGRLRAYSSPTTFHFADEAVGQPFTSLVSMRLMILVAAILLLVEKSLVLVLEAPLARFTHISRESVEGGLEVPSTSRVIGRLKTFDLLVVSPQQCFEAKHFVSLRQSSPSRLGGRCCNAPSCNLDGECRVRACACLNVVSSIASTVVVLVR